MNEIEKTKLPKLPKPGEWWVSDSGLIAFVVGIAIDGDPVWQQIGSRQFMSDEMIYFLSCFHHEPRCTGFDWVDPVAIDPGESYELLSEGTVLRPSDEVRQQNGTWQRTGHPGECVGSKPWVRNLYRRKIDPPAEVWPKWIIADHWSDTHYIRRDSVDEVSWYTIDGKKTETYSHEASNIDSLIANKTWRYATESEALARVAVHPDDVPLNPVPGKVVATGTVKLTPVQPDDWVEFDPAQITCPRVEIDWLTPRLGESQWGPALLVWSNATWAGQRENWKIRCRRCDLPVETSELDNMLAVIAEHTQQVRELTQRIGDLVQQVNQRDAVMTQNTSSGPSENPVAGRLIQPYPPRDGKDYDCQCARCGSSADVEDCTGCVDGMDHHDCGEDCCCCMYPEDNVPCDICDGMGHWYRCLSSYEWCNANPLKGREEVKRGQIEWYEIKSFSEDEDP